MSQNPLQSNLIELAILLAITACMIPSQLTQPTPTASTNAQQTTVVTTAVTLIETTLQASLITATPAFKSTKTLVPTPEISFSGTSLLELTDGSVQFTDYWAGMQILIPPEWLGVRVGELEYYQAWEKVGTQNAELLRKFASIQTLDPDTYRVTAVDIRPEHILYEHVPTLDVIFAQGDISTLNEVKTAQVENQPPLANYKLLSSHFQKTTKGIEIVIIEFQWESATSVNQHYISYSKRVLFKVPTGTVSIDLHIPLEQKDSLGPEFDQIIGSLTLFNP
jgi:hypothetical protein